MRISDWSSYVCSSDLTYSRAKSIQMSEDGQDVCILITTALLPTTAGAASVLAAVAPTATAPPFSSLRRDRDLFSVVSFTAFLPKDVQQLTCDPVDRRPAAAPAAQRTGHPQPHNLETAA